VWWWQWMGCALCLDAFDQFLREAQEPEDRIIALVVAEPKPRPRGRGSTQEEGSSGESALRRPDSNRNTAEGGWSSMGFIGDTGGGSQGNGVRGGQSGLRHGYGYGCGTGLGGGVTGGAPCCHSTHQPGPQAPRCPRFRIRVVIPGHTLEKISGTGMSPQWVSWRRWPCEPSGTGRRFEARRVRVGRKGGRGRDRRAKGGASRPGSFQEVVVECCAEVEASLLVVAAHAHGPGGQPGGSCQMPSSASWQSHHHSTEPQTRGGCPARAPTHPLVPCPCSWGKPLGPKPETLPTRALLTVLTL